MLEQDLWFQFVTGLMHNKDCNEDVQIFFCMKCEFSHKLVLTQEYSIGKPKWSSQNKGEICIPVKNVELQDNKKKYQISKLKLGMKSRIECLNIVKDEWRVGDRPNYDHAKFLRKYCHPDEGEHIH